MLGRKKEEKLLAKYTATDTVDEQGWTLYEPRPDAAGVMAAPVSHAFALQATWGTLSGKAGDMLVKSYADRDVDYPADVWIVDQALFQATYDASYR